MTKRSKLQAPVEEYLKEVNTELRFREQVYAKKVQDGKMSRPLANKRYLLMEDIRTVLEELSRTGISIENLLEELAKIGNKARPVQQKLFGD